MNPQNKRIKPHRVVSLILRDDEGRVLLQLRDNNTPIFPGCWDFFGGHIDEETTIDAVIREMGEELGVYLLYHEFRFFRKYEFNITINGKLTPFIQYVFVGRLDMHHHHPSLPFVNWSPFNSNNWVRQVAPWQVEGKNLGFFSEEDTKTIPMSKNGQRVINDIFAQNFIGSCLMSTQRS
jgi:8-oxo-dGTP pyrophosphatase MutT (NUDIX family)